MTKAETTWGGRLQAGLLIGEVVVVLGFVAVADYVVLSVSWPPVRGAAGLPLLLFLPGYALLSVVFPSRGFGTRYGALDVFSSGIDGIERLGLSFGVSLALLPPLGLVLWLVSPHGFGVRVLVGVLSAEICLGMLYGAYRRLQLPRDRRYRIPLGEWLWGIWSNGVVGGVVGVVMNVAVALSVVVAVVAIGHGVLVPHESETYTGVSLLTSADGEQTFVNNGTTVTDEELTLSIANHEDRTITYTVVVVVERVARDGERVSVRSSEELTRLEPTVTAGETKYVNHSVSPPSDTGNRRLRYLLYKGDPPKIPTADNAYRTVYVWIDPSG